MASIAGLTKSAWYKYKPARERLGLWLGAISLTVIGTIVFDWLTTGRLGQQGAPGWWVVVLFVIFSALIIYAAQLLGWFDRQVIQPVIHLLIHQEFLEIAHDIEPQPALIAFVSHPRKDRMAHENAVDYHLGYPKYEPKVCRYVRLICSSDSEARANQSCDELRKKHPEVTCKVGPKAVFGDLASNNLATEAAIKTTLAENPGLTADRIVVDVTGGTGITTAGAILVGASLGVTLEYIEAQYKDGKLDPSFEGARFKRVVVGSRTELITESEHGVVGASKIPT